MLFTFNYIFSCLPIMYFDIVLFNLLAFFVLINLHFFTFCVMSILFIVHLLGRTFSSLQRLL